MKFILLLNVGPREPVKLAEFPVDLASIGCTPEVLWNEVEAAVARTIQDLRRPDCVHYLAAVPLRCSNCGRSDSTGGYFNADGSRSYRCMGCGNAWTVKTPDMEGPL